MSRVGFMTLLNREDSVLSPHFGKAKWVMIRDDDTGEVTFERNAGLYGRAVVDILAHSGCTDAVFAEIGPGALRPLQEAGIRGWLAPKDVPVSALLDQLCQGKLPAAAEATHSAGGSGCHGHGAHGGAGGSGASGHGCCGQQRHGARLVKVGERND